MFDRRDPLCACFQTDQINLLSAGRGRSNSLTATLFLPLSPFSFFNSHNTRAVHRMFASHRRTVDRTRAYGRARRYLALGAETSAEERIAVWRELHEDR